MYLESPCRTVAAVQIGKALVVALRTRALPGAVRIRQFPQSGRRRPAAPLDDVAIVGGGGG
jgi:hypothetical protein